MSNLGMERQRPSLSTCPELTHSSQTKVGLLLCYYGRWETSSSAGRTSPIVHPETFTCLSTAGPLSICFRTCFPILSYHLLYIPVRPHVGTLSGLHILQYQFAGQGVSLNSDVIPSLDYFISRLATRSVSKIAINNPTQKKRSANRPIGLQLR